MKPPPIIKKPTAVFHQSGPLELGKGKITGVIALTLGGLAVLSVLAFHFPQYLTTPDLRKKYDVNVLREILLVGMVIAGGMALANLIRLRNRWLNGTALGLILLAVAMGGHRVPVDDFPDNTPYIGLDWFILDLLGSSMVFILIEKMFPLHREQPVFRPGWQTDFTHFIVNHLMVGLALVKRAAELMGGQVTNSPIYTGALGEYNGVIIRQSQDVAQGVNSSTAAAITTVRRAILLGAQAAVIGYGQANYGPMKYRWNEELLDHKRKLEVSAWSIWGMKKAVFNSADFGTVVVSTFATASS